MRTAMHNARDGGRVLLKNLSSTPEKLSECFQPNVFSNEAYFLYVREKPAEQAKLLRKVLSNCAVEALRFYPAYRKPYDSIFERVKTQDGRGERI